MRISATHAGYLLSAVTGAILWLATSSLTGRREAWDSPQYWTVTYPLGIATSGLLGYLLPERAWRWGLVLMLAQAVTLTFAASSFGLLPLGLIMFGVLAVPSMIAARVAAGIRGRARGSSARR
jgi:hypothetical protein